MFNQMCLIIASILALSLAAEAKTVEAHIHSLEGFYKGLEERKLLVRHQVGLLIKDLKETNRQQIGEKEHLAILEKNKKFFGFLVNWADAMKISRESKKYLKEEGKRLLKSAEQTASRAVGLTGELEYAEPFFGRSKIHSKNIAQKVLISAPVFQKESKAATDASVSPSGGTVANGLLFSFLAPIGALFLTACVFFVFTKKRSRERKSLRENEETLSYLRTSLVPMVVLNTKGKILWSNRGAKDRLNLRENGLFFVSNELVQEQEHYSYLDDNSGEKFLVEVKKGNSKKGKKAFVFFYPLSSSIIGKSYVQVQGSKKLGASLEMALKSANYLFSAARIPVAVEEAGESCLLEEDEERIVKKIVLLSYHMAKESVNPKVCFKLNKHGARQKIDIQLRNVSRHEIDFEENFGLEKGQSGPLQNLWSEIELALSSREGRAFMYDDKKDSSRYLRIRIEFNARNKVSQSFGDNPVSREISM